MKNRRVWIFLALGLLALAGRFADARPRPASCTIQGGDCLPLYVPGEGKLR
jgi:hypothetical protein